MRISFALSRLSGSVGDAWLIALCRHLTSQGHEVAIVSRAQLRHEPGFYGIPRDVRLEDAGPDGAAECPWHNATCWRNRLQAWKRQVRYHVPDVVVACDLLASLQTLLTLRDTTIPVVVVEQADPLAPAPGEDIPQGELPLRLRLMRKTLYPKATAVVFRTEPAQQWGLDKKPPWKAYCIPGFIAPPPPREDVLPEDWHYSPSIVSMGYMDRENEFPTLIHAFAQCSPDFPDWKLYIVGDGPERGSLEALLDFLTTQGLKERLLLPPSPESPWGMLYHADIMATASARDAFPRELCQGMACGAPGLAFDHSWHGGSVINHGEDGLLAPASTPQAYAEALRRLLADTALRRRLSRNAPQVIERFGTEVVMAQWSELLVSAAASRRK